MTQVGNIIIETATGTTAGRVNTMHVKTVVNDATSDTITVEGISMDFVG
jgi:hypothetical protein